MNIGKRKAANYDVPNQRITADTTEKGETMSDDYEEDEAYYEERNAELQRDLSRRIEELNTGTLRDPEDVHHTIQQAGKYHREEALPGIIRELRTSPVVDIRTAALMVLLGELGLTQEEQQPYWDDACHFVEADQDFHERSVGLIALGTIKRGTYDRQTLEILAPFVADENENEILRRSAYASMLAVIGRSRMEAFTVGSAERFSFPGQVDWTMVRSYLKVP
jgi:hypothetical protein